MVWLQNSSVQDGSSGLSVRTSNCQDGTFVEASQAAFQLRLHLVCHVIKSPRQMRHNSRGFISLTTCALLASSSEVLTAPKQQPISEMLAGGMFASVAAVVCRFFSALWFCRLQVAEFIPGSCSSYMCFYISCAIWTARSVD